ncbi:iron-containing alcohol dehydrogenase [Paraburkholderia domus]|jgi:Glycerol dehydrogenase and related enzymes|uniref:iron-containing alcohol dehydrogenase n=1 Tax=Paraburkholderia domus TaxID=2793075 RepID=UPI001911A4B6|nr:iron-containing alcohol dehydrogenase [Paraburkholderia domus]MBK5186288.1 iron-containing alcohol dehydrogenase [Burkholderia sp. R-69749]
MHEVSDHALSVEAKAHDPEVIIGVGGGKTVDSAEGIAANLDIAVVICPTIASNDAPTSLEGPTRRLVGYPVPPPLERRRT